MIIDTEKAAKRFEWLLTYIILTFKFVHYVLGNMIKTPDTNIETAGVIVKPCGRFELAYNPKFFASLNDAELTYVLMHEVLHLILHHCSRRSPTSNFDLWNKAADLAVNELIPENNNCKVPVINGKRTGCHVSDLKLIYKDVLERQNAEYYYDFLLKKQKEEGEKGKSKKSGIGDMKAMDDHSGWAKEGDEIAEEIIKAIVKRIEDSQLWGNISATSRALILAAQVKKINWRQRLRTWFGNQAWPDHIVTRKRPNRKTGYIHPGYRKAYVDRWLIAADTSGSIDNDLLAQWGGVVNQLVETLPIDFMQVDCEVCLPPKPYERRMLNLEFKGRGGTDFQPIIDAADKGRYKGLMILTDGEASAPTKPKTARVVWVCPEGKNPPVDWGDVVHLSRHS